MASRLNKAWDRTKGLRSLARGMLLAGLVGAAVPSVLAAGDLIISEYVEGSSNNKAVELYNGTGADIDLAGGGYQLQMYFNGGTSASVTIALNGTVPAGGVFVLAHGSAIAEILAEAQQTNSAGWFNGDDAIVLRRGTTVVDSLGQVGFDPGTEWGSGLASTADNTLRRKASVTTGDTDPFDAFDPAVQWEGFATNDISGLGAHQADGGGSSDAAPSVAQTLPADGATGVATAGAISIDFSEPVNVQGSWFVLQCSASGAHSAQVSGGPLRFTLQADAPFTAGESCTLEIVAANVTDQDNDDGPDAMAASHTVRFSVAGQASACEAAYTPAYAIQGRGAATPLSGSVTTRGVVVGDFEGASPALRGFYLQDADGDNDPATSDAVFVFNGNNDNVQLGQVVRVTGTVSEFQGQTQLSATQVQQCGVGSVQPVDVMLPMESAEDFERYEGMLVRLPQTLHVTEHFQLGRFGQVVLSSGERLPQPTAVALPGAPAAAVQAANNLNRILLDDAANGQNPDPIVFGRGGQPLSATNTLRGGDTVTGITGVMTYTWSGNAASGNAWRLRPVQSLDGTMPDFQPTNPRPDAPPNVGGSLRVAGFNVLNYFNTFSGCRGGAGGQAMDCRGAEDAAEFARQKAKTVAALVALEADVVGLVEIENDGYGPTSAMQDLVDALNAELGTGSYALVDADARTGQANTMGTDAIKVGFIYRPASVALVGQTAVLNSTAFQNGGDGAPRNRPALAQAFEQKSGSGAGERFIAVVNHLKSKGSACDAPMASDGQGECNAVRLNAANLMRSWLAGNPTGTGDPDVLVIGDLNAYAQEDPIRSFTGNGWADLLRAHAGPLAHAYVFDGQWGYLDHALATESMARQVASATHWAVNAAEPNVLDYNTNFKSAGQVQSLFAPDVYRNSDHDPVVVGLNLVAPGGCASPDTSATVVFGSTNSGVANRVVDKGCSIDDLILDEQAWSSQAAFLAHVSKVSFDLLAQRKITAAERSKLMVAAQGSRIGVPH